MSGFCVNVIAAQIGIDRDLELPSRAHGVLNTFKSAGAGNPLTSLHTTGLGSTPIQPQLKILAKFPPQMCNRSRWLRYRAGCSDNWSNGGMSPRAAGQHSNGTACSYGHQQ